MPKVSYHIKHPLERGADLIKLLRVEKRVQHSLIVRRGICAHGHVSWLVQEINRHRVKYMQNGDAVRKGALRREYALRKDEIIRSEKMGKFRYYFIGKLSN